MPTGPRDAYHSSPSYESPEKSFSAEDLNHNLSKEGHLPLGDQTTSSILESVREQEAQFEQLTRELEAERQTVASQLDKYRLGSETASMSSISSTDESFHWRPPALDAQFEEEESDADSRLSGSQLVDSCLRVLQERGLMNVGENPQEYLPTSKPMNTQVTTTEQISGPGHHSVTTVTTRVVKTTHHVQESPYGSAYPPPSPAGSGARLPSNRGDSPLTPSRSNPNYAPGGYNYPGDFPGDDQRDAPYDSFDHPFHYRDNSYSEVTPRYNGSLQNEPPYATVPATDPRDSSYSDPRYGDEAPYGSRPEVSHPDSSFRQGPPSISGSYRGEPSPLPQNGYSNKYPNDPQRYGGNLSPRDSYQNDRYSDRAPSEQGRYPDNRDYQDPGYNTGSPRSDHDPYGSAGPYPRAGSDRPLTEDPYGRMGERPPYADSTGPGDETRSQRSHRTASPAPSMERSGLGAAPLYGSQGRLPNHSPLPGYGDHPDSPYHQGSSPAVNRREPPYNQSEVPYNQREPPYNQSEPPYDQSEPPYNQRELPYNQSDQPYNQGESPYNQGEPPYNGRDSPYGSDAYRRPPNQESPYGEDQPDWQPQQDFSFPLGVSQPSGLNTLPKDQKWRNPDLPEVIEFLGHPNDAIKANAAAYLQHLCYMDDAVKAKTRALNGIPVLVALVGNGVPEVHRSACGALRNLSYGKSNDENKRAIKNAGGIPALVRLLRKTTDNDVKELVTGILWNLSSCQDLKRSIIDEGLKTLVDCVIIPHSGWNADTRDRSTPRDVYWSTVFRNGSGVLRNVSSDGAYARSKIRECDGLVEAILHIIRAAIGSNGMDNKSVENCVCILRNLSFACQEVQDKDYLKNRSKAARGGGAKAPQNASSKSKSNKDKNSQQSDSTGCFGGSDSKSKKKKEQSKQPPPNVSYTSNPNPRGQELLWHESIARVYLPLLRDCTNPETLEAAAGAVQNLAACEWEPAEIFRGAFRKEKGLPVIVELLNLEADRVVCSAAMALRNLALDPRNKELIGKYAMTELCQKLPPPDNQRLRDYQVSDQTLCAVLATLYEVIKNNLEFASTLLKLDGVESLVFIVHQAPREKFSRKAITFSSSILQKLWSYPELHGPFKARNFHPQEFLMRPAPPGAKATGKSPPLSAENTLHRPRMDQSGPTVAGYNENTLPYVNRPPNSMPPGYMEGTMDRQDPYGSRDRLPIENVPMQPLSRYEGENPYDNPQTRGDPYNPQSQEYDSRDYDPRRMEGSYNADPGRDYDRSYRSDYDSRDAYGQEAPPHQGSDPYPSRDEPYGDHYDSRPPPDLYADQRGPDPYPDEQGSNTFADHRGEDPYAYRDHRPPPGGVQIMPQGYNPSQDSLREQEPLYARVNKQGGSKRDLHLESDQPPPGGADSWV